MIVLWTQEYDYLIFKRVIFSFFIDPTKQNQHVFSLCLTRQIIKPDRGRKHHFVARAYAPSVFQECCDYRRQQ